MSRADFGFDGEGFTGSYFFTNIIEPKELVVKPQDWDGYQFKEIDRTTLFLFLFGESYSQYYQPTFEEFKKRANKIGDVAKAEGYKHATPTDNKTTEAGISSMSIKALSKYNESHPEGSLLKDI